MARVKVGRGANDVRNADIPTDSTLQNFRIQ